MNSDVDFSVGVEWKPILYKINPEYNLLAKNFNASELIPKMAEEYKAFAFLSQHNGVDWLDVDLIQ